jgi:hypothetical protein
MSASARTELERDWGYTDVAKKQELPGCVVFFARNDRNHIVYIRVTDSNVFTEHKAKHHAIAGVAGKPISKQRSS